jgi:hypothetical protein
MLGHLRESEVPPDVTYRVGNHLVTESSKMTPAVVGEKVVEPALVDYNGRKALVFVFGVSIMSTCDCVMCGRVELRSPWLNDALVLTVCLLIMHRDKGSAMVLG